ncbi:uncharacterized protein LOC111125964 isoform X2 [Crassostrea virginica]
MDFYQYFILATCTCLYFTTLSLTKSWGKTPSEVRSNIPIDEKPSSKYRGKRYLHFSGSVNVVEDAKIYTLLCKPDTKIKLPDGSPFIEKMIRDSRFFFMRWAPKKNFYKSEKFNTLVRIRDTDGITLGECNVPIESTATLQEMPNYLKAAMDFENIDANITRKKFGGYLKMFFITHRCDPPPPGTFLCENVVTGKEINVNKYGLLSDFYSFSEEKASPKCEHYKKDETFLKMNNLLIEYQSIMERSRNREAMVDMKLIYRNIKGGGKRKIQIHCKVSPKTQRLIKQVKALFIFYQPMGVLRHTRVLLAGMLDQLLWIDPYRVRMFPQFRNLLKDKDARAVVGKAARAEFQMNIILDECDILTGAFQCAMAADAIFFGNVIYRGMYDLKKTAAAQPGLECSRKGDNSTADASISLTMEPKSAGHRLLSSLSWIWTVQIFIVSLLSSF